ncbi:hypothetical protein Agau_L300375 [Agrobacterium tumefaciens F2]|nr:hypothetical protein Agau_L300375 [Agrobacterium tumefaciens F2]
MCRRAQKHRHGRTDDKLFHCFLLRGVRRHLSQPETDPRARRYLLTFRKRNNETDFLLFGIFIPFLVRTSMVSSRPVGEAAHKAVIIGGFGRERASKADADRGAKPLLRHPRPRGEDP